jgi:hypothetical protein
MKLHEEISRIKKMMGVLKEEQTIDEAWYNDIIDTIKKSAPVQKVKDIFKDVTGVDFEEKDTEEPTKSEIEKIEKEVEKELKKDVEKEVEKDTDTDTESKSSVKTVGKTMTITNTWRVPSSAPNKGDALHSFERRKSDGVGAKILSQIESKLKEMYDNGINPDIYELNIDIDSNNLIVKWKAKIGPSKDGKAYVGLASRGSAGGGADMRAKAQLPKLKSKLKVNGAEDVKEFLDFKNSRGTYIRQYFFKYTLPKKYPPH